MPFRFCVMTHARVECANVRHIYTFPRLTAPIGGHTTSTLQSLRALRSDSPVIAKQFVQGGAAILQKSRRLTIPRVCLERLLHQV